jgi:hypothetical protein
VRPLIACRFTSPHEKGGMPLHDVTLHSSIFPVGLTPPPSPPAVPDLTGKVYSWGGGNMYVTWVQSGNVMSMCGEVMCMACVLVAQGGIPRLAGTPRLGAGCIPRSDQGVSARAVHVRGLAFSDVAPSHARPVRS